MKGRIVGVAGRALVGLRSLRSLTFRGVRHLKDGSPGRSSRAGSSRAALILPGSADEDDLGDVLNRTAWYLGRSDSGLEWPSLRVDVFGPSSLTEVSDPPVPDHQEGYLDRLPRFTIDDRGEFRPSRYEVILVGSSGDLRWPRLWKGFERVHLVDPTFYSTSEVAEFSNAADRLMGPNERFFDLYRKNFEEFLDRNADAEDALVLGTGPSVTEIYDRPVEETTTIVCNSIVRNSDLLEYLQPEAICFADPVFHLGPSRYAAKFREDLVEAVRSRDCFAVTRDRWARLLLQHHPELSDRVIGLELGAPSWNVPTPGDPRVRSGTGNILTLLMLPLAASVARRIRIGGCDGREPDEDYFWEHDPSVQYEGLMQTAVEAHPSFFRDRLYADYYEEHCRTLEDQLSWLETIGCDLSSVTHSHIPALIRRASGNSS